MKISALTIGLIAVVFIFSSAGDEKGVGGSSFHKQEGTVQDEDKSKNAAFIHMIPLVSLDAPAGVDGQPRRFTMLQIALPDEISTGTALERREEAASSRSFRYSSWELKPRQTDKCPSLGWAAQAECGMHATPNPPIAGDWLRRYCSTHHLLGAESTKPLSSSTVTIWFACTFLKL
jgi:hypothetical protein